MTTIAFLQYPNNNQYNNYAINNNSSPAYSTIPQAGITFSPTVQQSTQPQSSIDNLLGGWNQLNNATPQQNQAQNPMMQFFQMMMQMMMQMMGIQQPQQQQSQSPQQQAQAPYGTQNNSQGFPVAQNTPQNAPQNTQGFPVVKNANNGGAAASAAAGPNGAAASAAAGGKGGAAASAAAGGKDGAAASAAAEGKKDIKSMSNDELEAAHKKAKGKEAAEISKEKHRRKKEGDGKTSSGKEMTDPYEVNINGEKYVFVQDKNKNGKVDGESEFLGFNDKKGNLFNGMKKLDSNGDGQVSKAEMDAQGVKLQKVDSNGKLTSQAKDVQGVDLASFKENANFNGSGEAGSFNVKLADGQTVQGKEIFETLEKLKSYFS
ncbi:MAG: hypothetical protein AB1782_20385 [Cyanobacteriota bacterium]